MVYAVLRQLSESLQTPVNRHLCLQHAMASPSRPGTGGRSVRCSPTVRTRRTTLTLAQELIVVELRKTLLLSLDDLLAIIREFLCPDISRPGLDWCLHQDGVDNLRDLLPKSPKRTHQPFMDRGILTQAA